MVNRGLQIATPGILARMSQDEPIAGDNYYFRSTPVFDAPRSPYEWLTEAVFAARC
ncbi:DUF3237 family protein [Paracoccus alkanivorans]|uniref:DUF3237 family protein n=1 Tax=Paracoccus alkanivorans TaxID=2116655 RepID=A0A3M0LWG6_9RHOB|nr:DUF3237 family protein [Paracoccus alkanivorans]